MSAPVGVEGRLCKVMRACGELSATLPDGPHREHLATISGQTALALEALAQQPAAVDGDSAEALKFLLSRIGSWTNARWDQHLRHEFGDARAERMITALTAQHGGQGA